MTTELKPDSPVFRELKYEVDGRRIIAGFEQMDDSAYLTIRLKGMKRKHRMDLHQLAKVYTHKKEK